MRLNQRIFELMKTSAENHDIPWLKRSLQAAIEVEFLVVAQSKERATLLL